MIGVSKLQLWITLTVDEFDLFVLIENVGMEFLKWNTQFGRCKECVMQNRKAVLVRHSFQRAKTKTDFFLFVFKCCKNAKLAVIYNKITNLMILCWTHFVAIRRWLSKQLC
jgi:hypothetical protein